jgi:hypothetical protein
VINEFLRLLAEIKSLLNECVDAERMQWSVFYVVALNGNFFSKRFDGFIIPSGSITDS